jgi:hypothetical protein
MYEADINIQVSSLGRIAYTTSESREYYNDYL